MLLHGDLCRGEWGHCLGAGSPQEDADLRTGIPPGESPDLGRLSPLIVEAVCWLCMRLWRLGHSGTDLKFPLFCIQKACNFQELDCLGNINKRTKAKSTQAKPTHWKGRDLRANGVWNLLGIETPPRVACRRNTITNPREGSWETNGILSWFSFYVHKNFTEGAGVPERGLLFTKQPWLPCVPPSALRQQKPGRLALFIRYCLFLESAVKQTSGAWGQAQHFYFLGSVILANFLPTAGLSFSLCRERSGLHLGTFFSVPSNFLVSGLEGFKELFWPALSSHIAPPHLPFCWQINCFQFDGELHPQNGNHLECQSQTQGWEGLSLLARPRVTFPLWHQG